MSRHGFPRFHSDNTCQNDLLNLIASLNGYENAFSVVYLEMTEFFDRITSRFLVAVLHILDNNDLCLSRLSFHLSKRTRYFVVYGQTVRHRRSSTGGRIWTFGFSPIY